MFWGSLNEISRVVREVPIGEIEVPEGRVRRREGDLAAEEALRALAESIRRHGVVEPLLVRRPGPEERHAAAPDPSRPPEREAAGEHVCQLIAGERRLRAASMAGRQTVPCVFVEADAAESAVLAIVENLHREDLNLFESAAAIASLVEVTGMTQEQCAKRLGVSQSYVANKLRLLRLTEEERRTILENGLTERHSRALLRFPTAEERRPVLAAMAGRHMNVATAEEYVESLLCAASRAAELKRADVRPETRERMIVRDMRQFYGSIDRAVDVMRKTGVTVEATRKETPGGVMISILVPKSS
ncbi:MAG: ParB/RepB/Spo0J family partition protein [Clostridia bacterium]|nr:ParB/RepB/Spo0J family partition protein [Clostridia bacterium]